MTFVRRHPMGVGARWVAVPPWDDLLRDDGAGLDGFHPRATGTDVRRSGSRARCRSGGLGHDVQCSRRGARTRRADVADRILKNVAPTRSPGHKWTRDSERFDAVLRYTPPAIGTSTVSLRVIPVEGGRRRPTMRRIFKLVVSGKGLQGIVHEPRPSVNTTLVLGDRTGPDLRGFDARAGLREDSQSDQAARPAQRRSAPAPSTSCSSDQPKSCARRKSRALERSRGEGEGQWCFADRRPTGRYLDLIPSPIRRSPRRESCGVAIGCGRAVGASEIVIHRAGVPGGDVLSISRTRKRGAFRRARVARRRWPHPVLRGNGRMALSRGADGRLRTVLESSDARGGCAGGTRTTGGRCQSWRASVQART